ncbi:hypothetical protein AVEN_81903-1 [Araneus ventricosus]|uniref:Uncharacterized protein n=1 Tax=Araneus ventricosus TaxID=182803 RepID=A0A4Y2I467_ARAVE|nr:hypothetical protein AVEN_81903-1 [Araneus ventricosus]
MRKSAEGFRTCRCELRGKRKGSEPETRCGGFKPRNKKMSANATMVNADMEERFRGKIPETPAPSETEPRHSSVNFTRTVSQKHRKSLSHSLLIIHGVVI